MAIDAPKFSDDIVDFHAFDEGADALEIPMASTDDFEVDDGVAVIDDAHLPRANALGLVSEGFLHLS